MPEKERCKGIAVEETEHTKYYNSHFLHLCNYSVEAAVIFNHMHKTNI